MMLIYAALLVLGDGPAIGPGGAEVRAGCSGEAEVVGRLEAGVEVRVRFSMTGDLGSCYKVESGGVAGYVRASELVGLDGYRRGLKLASDRELPQMIRSEVTRIKEARAARAGSGGEVGEAIGLMETNRPREALRLIEGRLLAGRDAELLALAGLAAYQSDDVRRAEAYWRESLEARPDASVEKLYRRVRGEIAADRSKERVTGSRFVLRYDGAALGAGTAQELMDALGEEYARLSGALGCRLEERMTVVVQEREAYRGSTGAAEWTGGQFDGRIRVVVEGARMGAQTRAALAHEMVHACLARNGRFERWFHEGMAQRWSGERPPARLLEAARGLKKMPSYEAGGVEAQLFYGWAYLAVEALYGRLGEAGVRRLAMHPEEVPEPRIN